MSLFVTETESFLSRSKAVEQVAAPKELKEDDGHDHEIRCTAIGLFGFCLSILLIFCGLVVLVRLWIFKEISYNIFVFSMLGVGILFNCASINLTMFEGVVRCNVVIILVILMTLLPFVFADKLMH